MGVLRKEKWLRVCGKVRGIRGHKQDCERKMATEGVGLICVTPQNRPLFKAGDSVHVFEGTGPGQVLMRSVAWFGRVVGMKDGKYLVRNRILAGRGSPALVDGQYLTLQTDFGLGVGSGERTHFRNLTKRTRDRIEESVDRRNEFVVKEAREEIKKLKKEKTEVTAAHRERVEKVCETSNAAVNVERLKFKEQLDYWRKKSDTLVISKVKP